MAIPDDEPPAFARHQGGICIRNHQLIYLDRIMTIFNSPVIMMSLFNSHQQDEGI